MPGYHIKLDIFAGPFDLLLYLVRKEEVDIYDISITKITDQYIHYIEMLKSLDINIAGDFLVMAATLMEIKSAMLLPKVTPDQLQTSDTDDPRAEIIRQLLEYKKFKDAANLLNAAADSRQQRFARPDNIIKKIKPESDNQVDMDQVSIWDLLEAFDNVSKAVGLTSNVRLIKDDTPIDLYQIEILHRLQNEGPLCFDRIFEARTEKIVIIGLFLALLELTREKLIKAEQDPSDSSIYLQALTNEPAEQAVHKAIMATEDDEEDSPEKEKDNTEDTGNAEQTQAEEQLQTEQQVQTAEQIKAVEQIQTTEQTQAEKTQNTTPHTPAIPIKEIPSPTEKKSDRIQTRKTPLSSTEAL